MGKHNESGIRYKNRVGVQIITSRPHVLPILLASLKFQTFKKWDLIFVYQEGDFILTHETKALLSRLEGEGHRIKAIKVSKELGIGGMRNVALKHDDCEFGLRIDDDSLCEPDYMEKLYNVIKKDKKIGIVGGITPTIFNKEYIPLPRRNLNKFALRKNGFDLTDYSIFFMPDAEGKVFEVDHIRSSFMYRNKIAKKIKFPTYNDDLAGFREETDFCLRVRHAGYKVMFVPDAVCWHFLSPSGGTRPHWARIGIEGKNEADRRFDKEMRKLYAAQNMD